MQAIDADIIQYAFEGDKLFFVLPNIYILLLRYFLSIDDDDIVTSTIIIPDEL